MTKLCKDCKWYQRNWWGHNIMRTDSYDRCLRPNKSNYVSGKTEAEFCEAERSYSSNDKYCGTEGRFWEIKDE